MKHWQRLMLYNIETFGAVMFTGGVIFTMQFYFPVPPAVWTYIGAVCLGFGALIALVAWAVRYNLQAKKTS